MRACAASAAACGLRVASLTLATHPPASQAKMRTARARNHRARRPRVPGTASQPRHAGCMSSRHAPGCIQPQQRRPAAPLPHGRLSRRSHAQAGPCRGGETPPRDPPAPAAAGNRRGTVRARPCPPRRQPPAPAQTWRQRARARPQAAGACGHGGERRGVRRRPAGAGHLAHASASQSRHTATAVRRAGLAFARAPPKQARWGRASMAGPGRLRHRKQAGAPPPDPRQGRRPWTRPASPGASP